MALLVFTFPLFTPSLLPRVDCCSVERFTVPLSLLRVDCCSVERFTALLFLLVSGVVLLVLRFTFEFLLGVVAVLPGVVVLFGVVVLLGVSVALLVVPLFTFELLFALERLIAFAGRSLLPELELLLTSGR